jgi:hypothetical protein
MPETIKRGRIGSDENKSLKELKLEVPEISESPGSIFYLVDRMP